MKKGIALICALLLCLLAACSSDAQPETPADSSSAVPGTAPEEQGQEEKKEDSEDYDGIWEQAKIVDVKGEAVTALAENNSLLTFAVPEDLSFAQDALGTELKPGMTVRIGYNGIVARSYPGQITADCMIVDDYDDGLFSLYFDLLSALMDENYSSWEELQYYGFNFSGVSGLTQEECQALGWLFAVGREKVPLFGTVEDFMQEGYIDEDGGGPRRWNEATPGIAIAVTTLSASETDIKLEVETWYGNLGGGRFEAAAKKENGRWTLGQLVQTAAA